jgi:hypothetical protein
MTFALIFIANHIDKIHIITNETALVLGGVERVKQLQTQQVMCTFYLEWRQHR